MPPCADARSRAPPRPGPVDRAAPAASRARPCADPPSTREGLRDLGGRTDITPRVARDGLTVAVTGPTGDLGLAVVSALERSRRVKRIVGLARRPFDPAAEGWRKTEY